MVRFSEPMVSSEARPGGDTVNSPEQIHSPGLGIRRRNVPRSSNHTRNSLSTFLLEAPYQRLQTVRASDEGEGRPPYLFL